MSNISAYGWDSSGSALSNWIDGSRTIAKWVKVCDPNSCSLWCCGSVKEKKEKQQPRDSLFGMNTGGSALYLTESSSLTTAVTEQGYQERHKDAEPR